MAVGTKEVTINFAEPRQTALRDWLAALPEEVRSKLPPLTIKVSMNFDIKDFDEEEIADRFEELFADETSWVEQAYRMLAEGRIEEAMQLMYAETGRELAPPVPRASNRRSHLWQEGFHQCS